MNYTKRFTNETQSKLAQNEVLLNNLQSQQQSDAERENAFNTIRIEAAQSQQESKNNQAMMQSEYITILGIFASIVLAFTGGMTFSTSVLENISSSSIYRIIVISLILGLILFNVIWLLIDFLRDINRKTIRKWWIILLLNFLIIAGIAFMYFAYKGQWIKPDPINTPTHIENSISDSENTQV